MAEIHELIILFFVAVGSATFLPSQAELVLFAFLAAGKEDPLLLVLAATAGNSVGSLGNYYLGRSLSKLEKKPWFPVKKKYLKKPEYLFQKHGALTLLLAGLPFVGNPITITAGALHVRLALFIPLVTASKSVRYIIVWAIYLVCK